MAILRAAPGLGADDALHLHLWPAPAHPYLVGELERVRNTLVGQLEHPQGLRLFEADAVLEHLLARHIEDVVGHAAPPHFVVIRTPRSWR